MEENISQNAGKILLQIYIIYTKENKILDLNEVVEKTGLDKNKVERALEYCSDKNFLDIQINKSLGGNKFFYIRKITADGIDIIEKPVEEVSEKRPFNVTFNFNNEFNVESIIKGDAKLF